MRIQSTVIPPFRHKPGPWPALPLHGVALGNLWVPHNSVSPELVYTMGGLLLAVALLLFVLHRRQKNMAEAANLMENPAFIQQVLENSVHQRRKFAVVCTRKKLSTHTLNGHLVPSEEKRKEVVLELVAPEKPEEWAAAPVDVYFYLQKGEAKEFFHFASFVSQVEQGPSGWCLTLPIPSALTSNQRREFLRIEPGAGMVAAVTAWPQPHSTLLTLPTMPAELGRPPFAYRPPRVLLLELMDIAAGGVRLRLPVAQIRTSQALCAPGSRYIILLAVDALRSEGDRQLVWICATVRRAVILPGKSHVDLGMQFTHYCMVDKLSQPLEWLPVEPDGEVPFLLRWVGRANILLTRLTD